VLGRSEWKRLRYFRKDDGVYIDDCECCSYKLEERVLTIKEENKWRALEFKLEL